MFCYCAASRRLARTLAARYDAALSPAGLTATQFETISVLAALGSSSGRTLGQRLAVDKTTLSRNLKPLIAARLIRGVQDEADARSVLYSVTPTGTRKLARAQPLWQQAHENTLALLGNMATASEHTLSRMNQALL
jgi:DNA-binding MarR family transcriptional regulator